MMNAVGVRLFDSCGSIGFKFLSPALGLSLCNARHLSWLSSIITNKAYMSSALQTDQARPCHAALEIMTTQEGGEEHSVRFWNYPQPKEGPTVAYHNDAGSNPVLRGLPLAVAATLYAESAYRMEGFC